MTPLTLEQRAAVISEAKTWIKTPWRHASRIKGAGVDCAMYLLEVFERVGLTPHVVPPPYPMDWNLHRSEEKYLAFVEKYCTPIDGDPQPADIVAFKWGRCISHAAIVIEWPAVIHAYLKDGVCMDDALANTELARRYAGAFGFDHDKSGT